MGRAPSLFLLQANADLIVLVDGSKLGYGGCCVNIVNDEILPIRFISGRFSDSCIRSQTSGVKEILSIIKVSEAITDLTSIAAKTCFVCDFISVVKSLTSANVRNSAVLTRYALRLYSLPFNFRINWSSNLAKFVKIPDFLSKLYYSSTDFELAYLCKFSKMYEEARERGISKIELPEHWQKAQHDISMSEMRQFIDQKTCKIRKEAEKAEMAAIKNKKTANLQAREEILLKQNDMQ